MPPGTHVVCQKLHVIRPTGVMHSRACLMTNQRRHFAWHFAGVEMTCWAYPLPNQQWMMMVLTKEKAEPKF